MRGESYGLRRAISISWRNTPPPLTQTKLHLSISPLLQGCKFYNIIATGKSSLQPQYTDTSNHVVIALDGLLRIAIDTP